MLDSVTEFKHDVKIEEFFCHSNLRENNFGDWRTLQFLHILRIFIKHEYLRSRASRCLSLSSSSSCNGYSTLNTIEILVLIS